ncbi:hypothetical protein G3A56_14715 [Rhizobium oryzihabitans]|jgi:hypothetical protein|uniref:Uncharacterized protein n=1 Tax=Rhizobium oryzihabitans TaxID=2267833 RepID=A0A7L5BJN8_9HYPH|nr:MULTISPECIES: hypothetical protein [Rhizobium]MCW0981473.1 hypothetical protein [Agrobacterium sp. BT-220-3]QCM05538.1 hypothetical protein CFBP6626_09810 [Agrobacterium tumefaciens]CUX26722.1 Conserved hypothetical protein [Agrobacterium genomosp. 5 str. CFBP 6626]HBT68967.1 hypothetical protein [Agrobacterium sp.]QCM10703.1 hypothetical protein CFBP6625_10310 [Agrobacterium tumefaciens]
MITSNSMPISASAEEAPHSIDTPDLIDRLAAEMRATGDRELPHSFYVEQVKRTLAGKTVKRADNDEMPRTKIPAAGTSSVFQCWAMPE